mmetsp:Transcript_2196/g.6403  ORF Transcript_2196/g.6403 Transcript_2196/m.6403 type:complete len:324 (+) Transcript_2196:39-1010(+)
MAATLVHAILLFAFSTSTQAFTAKFGLVCGGICREKTHPNLSLSVVSSTSSDVSPSEADEIGGRGHVSIVYCTGCRWMMRSAYYAQELLMTFPDDLASVTLIPSRPPLPGGMLFVSLDGQTIWDRKERGRFPETKELKQIVRDSVSPERNLGHSDTDDNPKPTDKCEKCGDNDDSVSPMSEHGELADFHIAKSPHVTIKYCTGCKWLLRAAWDAQELLTTFADDLNSVSLIPIHEPAGQFIVELDGKLIWDRAAQGRHAEPKELKQGIRDVMLPNLDLGHSDVNQKDRENADDQKSDGSDDTSPLDELDDDEAVEMRSYFGVM